MKRLRSFVRQEPIKFGNVLVLVCMILSLFVLSFLKAHFCPAPNVRFQVPLKANWKIMVKTKNSSSQLVEEKQADVEDEQKVICDLSGKRSDICEIMGDVMIQGNSTTVSILNHHSSSQQEEWKIKPYNRKSDPYAMGQISKLSLKPSMGQEQISDCTQNHSFPAIIFSIGGFTGNLFHDFTDVLIPLFTTSHQFNGDVQFIVTDSKPWWIRKYHLILKQLTKHEIIDIKSNEEIHCYRQMIVGTNFHKELGIDPSKSPNGYSMLDFKKLVREAFNLERENSIQIGDGSERRPKLLIIARKRTRAFVNERGMVEMAKSLGYEVAVAEPDTSTDISKFARLVNSCDVLMGVHGAGLTNMVFLPHGAVVIQLIPLGRLEWLARESFKEPTMDMKLNYLEYSIQKEESTLVDQYPPDHQVLKDPFAVHKQGWLALKSVYLDKQNIRPHLGRLRITLLEALRLLHQPASA